MNIKELNFKNYRSYKDATIYFTEPVYVILGKIAGTEKSNGSGKSSIVSAIFDCLYGGLKDSDIHNNEKSCEIGLLFEVNGKDYKITRKLDRGKTQAVFINKKKQGIKAAEQILVKLLGANSNIFTNTAYFKQGDLDAFSKLTPKEAKDVVINILQLGIYNDYEKLAKEKISTLKSDILELESKIDNTEKLIKTEEEEQKESKYTQKDLEEAKELYEDYKLKVNLEKLLTNSKDRLIAVIKDKQEVVRDSMRELEFNKKDKEKRISKLKALEKEAKCPTCEHGLDKEEIKKIITLINNEILAIDKKLNPLDKQYKKLNNTKEEVSKVDTSISFEYKESDLISKITTIKEELKQKEKDKNKIVKLKTAVDEAKMNLGVKQSLSNRYEALRKAFGRNGIQAYIIENVLPEVQMTANDILEGLDTPIRISIDSQKDLKKGGKAETLDINVITAYGERPYSNYSGGEKTFIDFSLRMALAVILARRSNCQIQTLILDEVFGELDSINKQIISKALRYISNKFNFKKILIISHAEELQDSCENVIKVKFNGKCSTVTKEIKNVAITRSA